MSETLSPSPSADLAAVEQHAMIEPVEAANARRDLEQSHGDDLPRLVSMWIMAQKSPNTRKAYARGFKKWDTFCRSVSVHPMEARRAHADAYARTMEEKGTPNTTAAAAMSAVSSFYKYAISEQHTELNPFASAKRPTVDIDHSDTEGLTEDEMAALLTEAHKNSARSYALCMLLYTVGLRVDGALGADVTDLGYDKGHRTIRVKLKGGGTSKKALPPITVDALERYIDGRTEGPLFITRTGARMGEPEAWKMLRRLARKACLPQVDSIHPHVLRHGFITDALEKGTALHVVQDAVDHKDPRTTRRYDRARNRLSNSPAYTVGASIAEKLEHLSA